MLERLFQLLVPPDLPEESDIRATRFIVLVSTVALVFHVVATPVVYWAFQEPIVAWLMFAGGLLHFIGLWLLRVTRNGRLCGLFVVADHVLVLFLMLILFFPEREIFYIWTPYLILLATFSMGRRYGAILVGGLVALIWRLELWHQQAQPFPDNTFENPYALIISFSLALFMTGVVAWLFELTHRLAEQRLFTSEQKLRLHVEQTPLAVVTCSLEGIVTEWNPAAEGIFGYQRDEAVGKYVGELILPPHGSLDRPEAEATLWGLLDGEERLHSINRNRTKEGRDVYCEWFNTPLVEKDGVVVGVTSLAMNVGERIRAEEALRASEARFRRLAAQSPDIIVIYDWTIGRIIYTNRDTLMGYTWDQVDTLPSMLALIHPQDREQVYRNWQTMEFAPEGHEAHVNEFRVYSAEHEWEWLRSREIVLTRNASGMPTQMLATITVITDEKRHETELREAKEEAEMMARVRSQFLANMSHEIRTPMNGIIGMTSLLMDAELDPEHRDFIETIRRSGESLLTIINEILDFSKIESGHMKLEMQRFDLRECIEDAIDLLGTQAADKGLELGYWMEADVPPYIEGDVTRLRQILVNLLANALKFTEAGEVWVNIKRLINVNGGCDLQFAVHDTGIGIRQEQIEQLFNAFSQLDSSTTRRYGGTGLGLVISRRLAELMGGTMWVESEHGVGSTFYFTVRVDREGVTAETSGVAAAGTELHVNGAGRGTERVEIEPPTGSLGGHRILIVESNATSRNYLAEYARQRALIPETAIRLGEVLEGGFETPKLILVALAPDRPANMAQIAQLHQMPSMANVPIVLLATRNESNMRQRSQEAGATLVFYKPIKFHDLYNALYTYLAKADASPPAGNRLPERIPYLDSTLGAKHPLTILLAEDNVVNQRVALLILERLGYRADIASSGEEAVDAVSRQPYDVILMDVHMPEMDGIEATQHVLSQGPAALHPYIVAMTAAAMQEDQERCRAAGMHDFISKPVKIEELVSSLLRAEAWLAERIATP